jgi:hypothetical protein
MDIFLLTAQLNFGSKVMPKIDGGILGVEINKNAL